MSSNSTQSTQTTALPIDVAGVNLNRAQTSVRETPVISVEPTDVIVDDVGNILNVPRPIITDVDLGSGDANANSVLYGDRVWRSPIDTGLIPNPFGSVPFFSDGFPPSGGGGPF